MAININLSGLRNIKSLIGHFRRPLLLVLGVLIIGGTVVGVYSIGRSDRQAEPAPKVSEQTISAEEISNNTPTNEPSNRARSGSGGRITRSTGASANRSTHARTGPSALANTGPGAYSAIGASLMLLLLIHYRHGRQLLIRSFRQI